MKQVKVLGTGCARCASVTELVRRVAADHGVEIDLEKVEDMARIAAYGVMSTPAIVIDDKVVHAGGLPDGKAVAAWLQTGG